jgi:uncharacterized membrane protein
MFIWDLWWIFPLLMVALCLFMMRGRMGMMCGRGHRDEDSRHLGGSDSAKDILDKLYVLGKISKEEYEEKTKALNQRGGMKSATQT